MKLENSRKEEIGNIALDVLEDLDINEPVVNAVEIAKEHGIEVKEIDMPENYKEVAGFYNEKEKTIYVAKSDKPVRKLFTVAHELGHYFLAHRNYDVLYRVPKEGVSYVRDESEANLFAANLLMPEHLVRKYMAKYVLTKADYVRLAEIFGVPVAAMRNQLEYIQ